MKKNATTQMWSPWWSSACSSSQTNFLSSSSSTVTTSAPSKKRWTRFVPSSDQKKWNGALAGSIWWELCFSDTIVSRAACTWARSSGTRSNRLTSSQVITSWMLCCSWLGGSKNLIGLSLTAWRPISKSTIWRCLTAYRKVQARSLARIMRYMMCQMAEKSFVSAIGYTMSIWHSTGCMKRTKCI